MVQRLLLKMRQKIWFVPSVYSTLALLLAFIIVLIDTKYNYLNCNIKLATQKNSVFIADYLSYLTLSDFS